MCPACMATMALLIGSAVSSGGVAAVVVSKLLAPKGAKRSSKETESRKGNRGEATDVFECPRGQEKI